MSANVSVEKIREGEFQVRIVEGKSQTEHRVTLSPADHQRLSDGKIAPEDLIRRSFEFLLENEAKESILSQFDLPIIGRYFPNYEREIQGRISRKS
jgi:hypothetical protein